MEFRIEEIIQNLVDVANRNDIFVHLSTGG